MKERKDDISRIRMTVEQFLRAQVSFDETYQFSFINDLPKVSAYERGILDLLAFAGLTQNILDAEV